MHPDIAIIFNAPLPSRYTACNEDAAVSGVMEAVDAVEQALIDLDCRPFPVPLVPPIEEALSTLGKIDASAIFNLFEGFAGSPETEVDIACGALSLNIPVTGNPPEALMLGLDKVASKKTFLSKGIPTPGFQVFDSPSAEELTLRFPVIAKPSRDDASHGIYAENVLHSRLLLERVLAKLLESSGAPVLVEEFIDGREFNATVIGGEVLPVSEISYSLPEGMPRVLTFESKWNPESLYYQQTKVICPAQVSFKQEAEIKELASRAYKACGCHGYARVDIRQDECGNLYVLEVNPNPDISPGAGCARQAAAAGLTYTELIKKILEIALERS